MVVERHRLLGGLGHAPFRTAIKLPARPKNSTIEEVEPRPRLESASGVPGQLALSAASMAAQACPRRSPSSSSSCVGSHLAVPDDLLRVLSALGGMLGAVGSVAGQSTAVGGDKIIDEVQQLPYTWQGVQEYRECASEGGTHHRVYCLGASVAAAVRCYRPRGRLALFESEPYRGGNATLLEGHRHHATVAIERLEKAHRPRAEPTGAVEYKSKLWGPLSHSYQPDCTLAD